MPKMDPSPANRYGRANHHHGNGQAPRAGETKACSFGHHRLVALEEAMISRRLPVSERGRGWMASPRASRGD